MPNKSVILVGLLLVAIIAVAIPARRNVTRVLTLKDGAQIAVTLKGDEYGHWWESVDGRLFSVENDEQVIEIPYGESIKRMYSSHKKRAKRNAMRSAKQKIYSGDKKVLVILVNFKNKRMHSLDANEYFTDFFNKKGFAENGHVGSVHDYFHDQSYGVLNIEFDVVGPVTLSKNFTYYGQNSSDEGGSDTYPATMIAEACELVSESVDFSKYDWNNDGEVEQILVVYAGYGESSGAVSGTLWPHASSLTIGSQNGDGNGPVEYNEVKIDKYAVTCELAGIDDSTLTGIGTICHELSHCLGLPDFYNTTVGNGSLQYWDIMDMGAYNGPEAIGEVPSGYTAYERWYFGWLVPTELKENVAIEQMRPLNTNPDSYVVYNEGNKNEYYLLENRKSDKWFKYFENNIAPNGLFISHVDFDKEAWENNTVNTQDAGLHRMSMFMANNDASSFAGHLYPYNDNDSLTNNSVPAAKLHNANADGSKFMNKGIRNILRNTDGSMSFSFSDSHSEFNNGGGTIETPGDYIFYESFDKCKGTGGNDGIWSGTTSNKAPDFDNTSWESHHMSAGHKCLKLGTGTYAGLVTSPSFTLEGTATLSFKAGIWNTTRDGMTIDVYAGGTFIDQCVAKRGEWTTFNYEIRGNGKMSLVFVGDKRFFLDEVKVTNESTSITSTIFSDESIFEAYSLMGIRMGTKLEALPAGVYVVNGKKIVKR